VSLPLQEEEQGQRHFVLQLIQSVRRNFSAVVIRSLVYFGVVFGVGFILGAIRVLLLVPRFGDRVAELIEAPLMLAAIYFAARFITKRFEASRRVEFLHSGLVALLFMLAVEFSVVLALQGQSIREYLAERDPVAGTVYVVMLVIFAAMPYLVGRDCVTAGGQGNR
jgi:hypothetical protein